MFQFKNTIPKRIKFLSRGSTVVSTDGKEQIRIKWFSMHSYGKFRFNIRTFQLENHLPIRIKFLSRDPTVMSLKGPYRPLEAELELLCFPPSKPLQCIWYWTHAHGFGWTGKIDWLEKKSLYNKTMQFRHMQFKGEMYAVVPTWSLFEFLTENWRAEKIWTAYPEST